MLEPLDRRHLLEALRPPADYDLSVAIGTTFTLDLMTLLTVPLAFALADWEDEDGRPNSDPLALLEAIRRYADRTHIFCQAGGICVPKGNRLFLSHVEDSVHEVVAPKGGIFHPKVWVLRFESAYAEEPVIYRVLVSSRNLTFDRSWDTLLLLEGKLMERMNVIKQCAPLGDFIDALPDMMVRSCTRPFRKQIRDVADDLRRVRFELPPGFDDMSFHPIGLAGTDDWAFGGRIQRMLTISPFLDPQLLPTLGDKDDGDILVSRLDQLQQMPSEVLDCFDQVYSLSPDADPEDVDEDENGSEAKEDDSVEETLSGLHAKLFVADDGGKGRIWTGSANATQAAMRRNVEFLVELVGKKRLCGVDAILSPPEGRSSFMDLLSVYSVDDSIEPTPPTHETDYCKLTIRTAIASSPLEATVTESDSQPDTFDVILNMPAVPIDSRVTKLEFRVWPVTVQEAFAKAVNVSHDSSVLFEGASFESLTTFYAIGFKAQFGKDAISDRFVVSVPVQGMPSDRRERVLRGLLKNQDNVMRFLLFLLADGADLGPHLLLDPKPGPNGENPVARIFGGSSLLEPLLNALNKSPEQLDRVARVVEDLVSTEEGASLLPDGFMDVWEPVWAARREIWK
jgi:hypothetical protein